MTWPPIVGPPPPGGLRFVFVLPPGLPDRKARKLARVIRRRMERAGVPIRRSFLVTGATCPQEGGADGAP